MSTTVDQRVVEMRFDNKQFEANVSTTMSTLDKLKRSLKLPNASKGLQDVSAAAKKCDLAPIGTAVDTVRARFSALDVVAMTALSNITTRAMQAGERIVKALTIDPVKTGFSEYETKINAIQTILSNTASKGTTMEDVTRVINELNTYADKTIYNFAEMTRNIGTFTAAGVGLEESAAAIQGIANLAAASGSTSQQASTAMYQLSQALAAGTVKLMDWNSVVNAGMGGEKFQEALKATAREHGVAVDKIIKEQGSFRDSLQEGWISADILNETLRKFTVEGATEYAKSMLESGKYTQEQADALVKEAQAMEDAATKVKTLTQLWDTMKESAQSGWAQTWEIIVGDFEEAKEFFSGVSDAVGEFIGMMSDARNNLLEGVMTSSWKKLSQEVAKTGIDMSKFKESLIEVGKKHKVITDDMIKDAGGFEKSLKSGWLTADIFTETLKKFSGDLSGVSQSTDDMNKKLENFQKVVNDVWHGDYKNGKERIEALTKAGYDYATVQELVNKTVDGHKLTLADLTDEQAANLGFTKEQVKELRKLADQAEKTGTPLNDLINNLDRPSGRELFLGSITNVLYGFLDTIKAIGRAWSETFQIDPESIYNILEAVNKFTQIFVVTDDRAKNITKTFKGLFAILDIIATLAGGALRIAFKVLTGLIGNIDSDIWSMTAAVGEAVSNFRDWLFYDNRLIKAIQNGAGHIRKWVKSFLVIPEVQKTITSFESECANVFKNVKKYFAEGGERINNFLKYASALDSISLDDLQYLFRYFKDTVVDYFIDLDWVFDGFSNTIESLEAAITPHVEKIKAKFNELKDNVVEFGDKVVEKIRPVFERVKEFFSGITGEDVLNAGKTLGLIAILYQLYRFLKNFADLPGSISGTFEEITAIFTAIKGQIKVQIFKDMAIAVAIIAASIFALAQLDWKEAWKAVAAVAGIIVVLFGVQAGLAALSAKFGALGELKMAGFAAAILGLSLGIGILALAFKALQNVSWKESIDALKVMGVMLASLAGAGALIAVVGGKIGIGAIGLLSLATSLLIFYSVLKLYAVMDMSSLNAGLTNLTSLLIFLGAFLAGVGLAGKGTKFGGLAVFMLSLVGALYLLEGVIKMYAAVDWNIIWAGLGKIAVLAGSILAFIAVLNLIKFDQSGVGGALKAIAVLAAGLLVMTASVLIFAFLPFDALIQGAVSAGALILALGGALALASKFESKKGLAGIIAMGAVVAVFTGSILFLKDVPWDQLLASAASLGALILALGFAIKLSASGTFKSSAGLALLAVGVLALAGSLYALSSIPFGSLMGGVLGLALALGVLVATAFGMQYFAVGAAALSGVLGSFALVILSIGAAALMLAGAFYIVGLALPSVGDGLTKLGTGIENLMGSLMACVDSIIIFIGIIAAVIAIGALGSSGMVAFGIGLGVIGLGLVAISAAAIIFAAALAIVGAALPSVGDGLASIGEGISSMIKSIASVEEYLESFHNVMDGLGKTVGGFLTEIGNGLITLAIALIGAGAGAVVFGVGLAVAAVGVLAAVVAVLAFAAALIVVGASLVVVSLGVLALVGAFVVAVELIKGLFGLASEAGENTTSGFANGITNGISGVIEAVTGFVGSVVGKICELLGIHSPSTVAMTLGQYTGEGFALGLDNSTPTVEQSSANLANAASGNFDISSVTGLLGSDAASSFADGMSGNSFLSDISSSSLADSAAGNFDISKITELLGSDAASSFADGMGGNLDLASGAGLDVSGSALSSITDSLGDFGVTGFESGSLFSSSMSEGASTAPTEMGSMISSMLGEVSNSGPQFAQAGSDVIQKFITGMKSQVGEAKTAASFVSVSSAIMMKMFRTDFYNAGRYLVEGFAEGITANTFMAEARAAAMARAAADAAAAALDEHSPSKVGYGIGAFFGEGFVNGIASYNKASDKAGSGMANMAKTGLSEAIAMIKDMIENDIDTQPTIRPVLDLSDVESGSARLQTMFSRSQAMTIGASMNHKASGEIQNGESTSSTGSVYNFTQNNYSPKALSRVDIYRQTKNQFSAMERMVSARD